MKSMVSLLVLFLTFVSPPLLFASEDETASEMKVQRVMLDPYSKMPVVILESVRDKRMMPIWIDVPEAKSIALELEHVETPRPLTHDLIRNILQGIGARLEAITITDLRQNTYFAVLNLRLGSREYRVDSRPSDAIAVALRMKAPIYASARVLAKAGPTPFPDNNGEELRKTLGIHPQDLTPDLISLLELKIKQGVLVADVTLGSLAAGAGIHRGDIITKLDGQPIDNISDMASFLQRARTKAPTRIQLEIIRKGKPATFVVDLPS
jgi:uncharacterized protein